MPSIKNEPNELVDHLQEILDMYGGEYGINQAFQERDKLKSIVCKLLDSKDPEVSRLIKASDLKQYIKEHVISRSSVYPDGWIDVDDLISYLQLNRSSNDDADVVVKE